MLPVAAIRATIIGLLEAIPLMMSLGVLIIGIQIIPII